MTRTCLSVICAIFCAVGLTVALSTNSAKAQDFTVGNWPSGSGFEPDGTNPGITLNYNAGKWLTPIHIAAGWIDLTLSGLVTSRDAFGYTDGSYAPIFGSDAIQQACHDGANFATGYWDGDSGIKSSTAANDPSKLTAVGWVDNANTGYSTWRGIDLTSIPGDQALISYTYVGDANLDGTVDYNDLAIIENSIANPPAHPTWQDGDFNYDGKVDSSDLALFWKAYNADLPSLNYAVTVPEPGTASLLAAGIAALAAGAYRRLKRKRR